jgi:hypothetical protein
MFQGVLSVEPLVAEVADYIARQRVREEFKKKLWQVLESDDKA